MVNVNELLNYATSDKKQAWIGTNCPYEMDCLNILEATNFRMDSSFHRKYDIVWFYETLFDSTGVLCWKILLDELLRLVKNDGLLIIRMRSNEDVSLFSVKKFLYRKFNIKVNLEFEYCDYTAWICAFRIHCLNVEIYKNTDWSFGILTSGKRTENVIAFLDSVRKFGKDYDTEIIISGPRNSEFDKFNVKYLDMDDFRDEDYAEISKKKNAIIKVATKTNVMIIHDRFLLDSNFFKGFLKYGYDFDFLTVKQFLLDGTEFPCYAATNEKLRLCGQRFITNFNYLYENQFINGGLLIFKRKMVDEIPLNDLLMWGQMEDVEFTASCIEVGAIPRVNFISSCTVLDMQKDYLKSWSVE